MLQTDIKRYKEKSFFLIVTKMFLLLNAQIVFANLVRWAKAARNGHDTWKVKMEEFLGRTWVL